MKEKLDKLRQFYDAGNTRDYSFRRMQLQRFRDVLLRYEQKIFDSLFADLGKEKEEAWATELGQVISEINYQISSLRRNMSADRVATNLLNLPSSSKVYKEPLGVVLIIAPWNYPLLLMLTPLAGAIAAGNCAVLKPSEHAPATSDVILELIGESFDSSHVTCIDGNGAEVVPKMMSHFRFDHIFFTGGLGVGRSIYQMAAEKLVPVTLELGGKSPCIVESDADLRVAAKRIALSKFTNAGQTCIAPDYVLVQNNVKDRFLQLLSDTLHRFFNADAGTEFGLCRIVNQRHFARLTGMMSDQHIYYGGRSNPETLQIEPTVLVNVSHSDAVMQEEIFGPLLPVIGFETAQDAVSYVRQHPNPLASYIFTTSRQKEAMYLEKLSFGNGCINNASWQYTNRNMPFGGRGESGFGAYHGKHSFNLFSHHKPVMKTPNWFDPSIKYPPFKGKLGLLKKLFR